VNISLDYYFILVTSNISIRLGSVVFSPGNWTSI